MDWWLKEQKVYGCRLVTVENQGELATVTVEIGLDSVVLGTL